jgi:ABC-type oligopeptide transport system ATPase subunit
LSLAHRLLEGEPGFLFLDDPFLASDSSRLANQLNALKNLVQEQGWQILYFSVKEEVLRHLEKKIPSGILHMENGFIKE